MAKRRERITINGEIFTIENRTVSKWHRGGFMTLDSCYDRPSRYKEQIYDYWCNYFAGLGCVLECGITGYNCMQFSFGAYFEYDGVEYYAHITKAYNRLYRVEG